MQCLLAILSNLHIVRCLVVGRLSSPSTMYPWCVTDSSQYASSLEHTSWHWWWHGAWHWWLQLNCVTRTRRLYIVNTSSIIMAVHHVQFKYHKADLLNVHWALSYYYECIQCVIIIRFCQTESRCSEWYTHDKRMQAYIPLVSIEL